MCALLFKYGYIYCRVHTHFFRHCFSVPNSNDSRANKQFSILKCFLAYYLSNILSSGILHIHLACSTQYLILSPIQEQTRISEHIKLRSNVAGVDFVYFLVVKKTNVPLRRDDLSQFFVVFFLQQCHCTEVVPIVYIASCNRCRQKRTKMLGVSRCSANLQEPGQQ